MMMMMGSSKVDQVQIIVIQVGRVGTRGMTGTGSDSVDQNTTLTVLIGTPIQEELSEILMTVGDIGKHTTSHIIGIAERKYGTDRRNMICKMRWSRLNNLMTRSLTGFVIMRTR
jgi:hypothetical protein